MKPIKRRDFLKNSLLAGSAVMMTRSLSVSGMIHSRTSPYQSPEPGEVPDIVTISADNLQENIARLLQPFGGVQNFVKPGQTVGLLANSPWKNTGCHTNPDIVIMVAKLCLDAGAREIICLKKADTGYWSKGELYETSKEMVDRFIFGNTRSKVEIPKAVSLKSAEIVDEFLKADVFINLAVAKHHVGCLFSGNLKGLMGVSSSETNRYMHSRDGSYSYDDMEYMSQCIADLNLLRKPDLCITDAMVCIINNGPAGPGETIKPNKIIAGKDPLAVDVFAAQLIGFSPDDILMFNKAAEHGIGELDPSKVKLLEL